MTKAEIVNALYAHVGGFSRKECAELMDIVFDTMKETLSGGEKIKISGFGNFVLRDKGARPGRNPQTGEPIRIAERRVLTFKASQLLKQALNRPDHQVPESQKLPREETSRRSDKSVGGHDKLPESRRPARDRILSNKR
ncbi:MAG: integration host factor subunit alpha [Myxococcales bacterium]|jgi:integration host factor subunit alpha